MHKPLQRLSALGQSVWIDLLSRESIRGGHLQEPDRRGLGRRGDVQPDDLSEGDGRGRRLRRAAARARRHAATSSDTFWALAEQDIKRRVRRVPARLGRRQRPRRVRLAGGRPALAYDTLQTFREAMRLHESGRPAEPARQDPRDQARAGGDRGRDRQGALDQRHADLLAAPLRGGGRVLHPRHRAARSPRAATRARWRRWRASSSRASTPRPTGAWMRSARHDELRASSRSPTRSSPTSTTWRRSRARAGSSWRARAPRPSGCCGRRPRPRTPPTRTRCTWTS